MDVVKKIANADWISASEVQSVMQVLGGGEHIPQAMFVGGCVRNALMGVLVSDIDVATIHEPDFVMIKLHDAGIKVVPTGVEHGTVTAILGNKKFEITTLRRDVETDGRHAVVSYTQDWRVDASRRDFTMNTLLADIHGNVYDPTASGLQDLQKKRVVFVGDADTRIQEDYLRILRFFRFHGLYGEGEPDKSALSACKKNANGIVSLSKERVGEEFFKILSLYNVADILSWMKNCNLMTELLQNLDADVLGTFAHRQHSFDCVDVVSRYLLLTNLKEDIGYGYLLFSNAEKKHTKTILQAHEFLSTISPKTVRASVYWYGNKAVTQAYLLKTVLAGATVDVDILDIAHYWRAPDFPVTGADLMAQGYVQGAELGVRLREIEQEWVDRDFHCLSNS